MRHEIISLNDFSNLGQVRIQLKVYSGGGNRLFVDNIDLIGTEGTPIPDFSIEGANRCVNQIITFQDSSYLGYGWTWNFGEGATPSTATGSGPHQVVYSTIGNKAVVLTLGNEQSITKNMLIDECLSIDQVAQAWTLMYPNPTKGEFTVKSNAPIQYIHVIDLTGRSVIQITGSETEEMKISTEHWALGTYIVEIRSGHGRQTLKLVKE